MLRLERPWRAFTAGWPVDIMARNLGINSSFISGDHCYVLVRVSSMKHRPRVVLFLAADGSSAVYRALVYYNSASLPAPPVVNCRVYSLCTGETAKLKDLPPNISVEDVVYDAIQDSNIGDTVSIADFIRKYGSHYIASYITGNSLYQVFVFSRSVYGQLKNRVKAVGIGNFSATELDRFFSPAVAKHVGAVKVRHITDTHRRDPEG
ncbi:Torso-like protein [Eumeta japonica]|uniref:Torso-like protein n=1 Tax=Eumeta variegata TaxID=151549 RepID=A0A4C1Y9U4_EUMVA|nr:Torso-like protein [Eumeta japonica]